MNLYPPLIKNCRPISIVNSKSWPYNIISLEVKNDPFSEYHESAIRFMTYIFPVPNTIPLYIYKIF